uniref:Putative ribonuclease H-like domain-containing protein n=1 Tax=Tanacetum cinerariifolium TaxID=118510 RepID=A0A6L2JJ15_TANCI|nr:putative ribonuclease H-like domain-containing protein [Tanacetum cinerariifolium]
MGGYSQCDSLDPTRVIEGVVHPAAPTTTEQRLARKNELKARSTLLMALPDKHQLKFNIHKDAKTLMEATDKKFALVEPLSAVANVYAASAKIHVSALPNVDTLSNAVIYSFFASQSNSPQLDNDDLKQIDADDLEEIDLKWQMAMLTVECYNCHMKGHFARECRSPKDTRRNVTAEPQRRHVPVETSTSNALVSQSDGFESVEARLLVYQQNEVIFEEDVKLLKLDVQLRDNALVIVRQKCKKAEQERDEFQLKLEKFQTSSKNLSQLLASHTNDKTGLGYNNHVFTSAMSDCDEMFSSETDESLPASPIYDKYQSGEAYHVVPPPYTGIVMPPNLTWPSVSIIEDWVSKSEDDSEAEHSYNVSSFVQPSEHVKTLRPSIKPVENSILATNPKTNIPKPQTNGNSKNRKTCFVCKSLTHLIKDCDFYEKRMVQTPARHHAKRGNSKHYARMSLPNPQRHMVPTLVLTKSKLVPLTAARPVTTAVPQPHVTRPRPAKTIVTKSYSPPRRNINHRLSPKPSTFPPKVTTVKVPQEIQVSYGLGPKETLTILFLMHGNPQHDLKDKKVIDNGCSRHKTWNMSYLSDFEKINGGYVSFDGNPKGGKIIGKGKIRTDTECIVLSPESKLSNENQVLLRATSDESKLWHTRLGHINFKTMNKLVKGNLVRGLPSNVFENNHKCVACKKGKQDRASCKTKPVSSVSQPLQRVLVTKPHNKNPYELLLGKTPSIGFMRPFGCPVTILNTLDPLGKFDEKADEGFLVGYSVSSKDFRVFNSRTRIIQETLHINFLENKPNVAGSGPTWLFHIDTLTKTMNYQPVTAGNQSNPSVGVQEQFDAEKAGEDNVQQYVLFPLWSSGSKNPQNTDDDDTFKVKEPKFKGKKPESEVHVSPSSCAKIKKHNDKTTKEAKGKSPVELSTGYRNLSAEFDDFSDNNINEVNAASTPVLAVGQISTNSTNTFSAAGPSNTVVSPTLEKSTYVDTSQYSDDLNMPKLEDITYSDDEEDVGAQADFTNLEINIPEEGIDYEEVFAPVARIEAIRLFLAYASFMGFMVYQMDVKSAFMYGTIKEEVYICQPLGFEDPDYPDKVYKVDKALYGLHQAPGAWYETLIYVDDIIFGSTNKDLCQAFEKLMKEKFQMSSMGKLTFFLGLQVKQKLDGIFINQDKYIAKTLRKFVLTDRKSASTLIDTEKPLLKDLDGEDVDVHTYRSMIGSLMYLTLLRPDIMFEVFVFAHFQVTPKVSYLHAVKRIFRYLKGKPHLGLWYPKYLPFNLVAYSDNDYVGASLDRKSITGGCQFLGCRLISWQCKKQTVFATSSTEAKYVVATSSCAQVLWIQNQLLDYGIGKGFSGVETPLFKGMIVAQQTDEGDAGVDVADEGAAGVNVDAVPAAADEPSIPSPTLTTQPPPPS